jgi:hypothetical protein
MMILKLMRNEIGWMLKLFAGFSLGAAALSAFSLYMQDSKYIIVYTLVVSIFGHLYFQGYIFFYMERRERLVLVLPVSLPTHFLFRYANSILLISSTCLLGLLIFMASTAITGSSLIEKTPFSFLVVWGLLMLHVSLYFWQQSFVEWVTERAKTVFSFLAEYVLAMVTFAFAGVYLFSKQHQTVNQILAVLWSNGTILSATLILFVVLLFFDYFFFIRRRNLSNAFRRSPTMRYFESEFQNGGW